MTNETPEPAGVDTATAFFVFRAFPVVIVGGLDSVVGAIVPTQRSTSTRARSVASRNCEPVTVVAAPTN